MRCSTVNIFFALSCLFIFSAPRCFYYNVRRYIAHNILLVFIGFNATGLSFAGDSEILSKQFLTEAPQKEAEYLLFARRLQGNVSTTFTIFDSTGKIKNRMRGRKEIKQNERCASFLYQLFDGEKTDVDDKRTAGGVLVVNPQYAFELMRDNSKRDWLLKSLELHGDGASFANGKPIRETPLSWTSIYDVYGWRVSALIQEKDFRVIHARATNRNGRDLVQIDFIYPHPIRKHKKNYFVQGGSLFLDPAHFWCVREYDLKTKSIDGDGTMRALFEFKESSDGHPIVTHMVRTGKSPLGNVSEEVFEFDLHEVKKLPPDEEFTLSAFDLPEPIGVEPIPPSRTWMWLLVATVVAATLAILFAWLKRRHTRTAPRPSITS